MIASSSSHRYSSLQPSTTCTVCAYRDRIFTVEGTERAKCRGRLSKFVQNANQKNWAKFELDEGKKENGFGTSNRHTETK